MICFPFFLLLGLCCLWWNTGRSECSLTVIDSIVYHRSTFRSGEIVFFMGRGRAFDVNIWTGIVVM